MLMLLFLQCYKLTSTPAKIKQEEKEKNKKQKRWNSQQMQKMELLPMLINYTLTLSISKII